MLHWISYPSYISINFHVWWRCLWLSIDLVKMIVIFEPYSCSYDCFVNYFFIHISVRIFRCWILCTLVEIYFMHDSSTYLQNPLDYLQSCCIFFIWLLWLSLWYIITMDLWTMIWHVMCEWKLSNKYVDTVIRWTNCCTNDRTCDIIVLQRVHAIALHITLFCRKTENCTLIVKCILNTLYIKYLCKFFCR